MKGEGSSVKGNGQEQLAMGVTRFRDDVVLHLSYAREYVVLSPEQASQLAEQLARCAFEAHYDREAPDRGSELARQIKAKAVDDVRPRLIRRAAHIIRSLTEQQRSFEYIAEHTVDGVLKEVT